MPLPKVNPRELKKNFINRCAADPIMNKEFPKTPNRLGVCYSIYRQHQKKHGAKANWDDFVKETRKNGINLLP